MALYRLSRLASADLDGIWEYIAIDNPAAARETIAHLIGALDRLTAFPGIGAKRDELVAGLRSFPVGPYLILYRIREGTIEVSRIVHGARNIQDMPGL